MNLSKATFFGRGGGTLRSRQPLSGSGWISAHRAEPNFLQMPDNPLNRNNVGALNTDHPAKQPKSRVLRPVLSAEAIAADRRRRQFFATFPEAEFVPEPGCDVAHLLKCDLDLQLNHIDCWGAVGRARLDKIYRKVNYDLNSGEAGYWKNQRGWKEYDRTATLIALFGYHGADDFCDCGFHG